jgi:uncharacterized protein (AIM24 family)
MRQLSDKQERKIAENTGGEVVVNSGATTFRKGDVTYDYLLVDGKTVGSIKKSVSIKRDWLRKLASEAFIMRKPLSAVAIDFGADDRYYVVSEKDFKSLYDAWLEINAGADM